MTAYSLTASLGSDSLSGQFTVSDVTPGLAPVQGAWFGAYPSSGNGAPGPYEALAGRDLDVVVRYEKFDAVWPAAADKALVAGGRFLSCRWACALSAGGNAQWTDITAGKYDSVIRAAASYWAAWDQPMIVSFCGEFDSPSSIATFGGGNPANFAPAWRHIWNLVRPVAPKIAFAWVVTGYSGNYASAAQMHPGVQYADWHGADLYDATASKGSPLATYQPWMTWLAAQPFGQAGIPAGIFETGVDNVASGGTVADATEAAWIRRLPADCSALGIRLMAWFNSGTAVIPPGSQSAAAMAAAGADPYFSQPHS